MAISFIGRGNRRTRRKSSSEYMANDLNKVTIGVSITKRYVYDPKSDCVMLKVAD
jgi:hypothetical protein